MRVNLIEARKAKRLTQTELAKRVGLSKQALCNIEKGRSQGRVDTWDKLAAVLKVKADILRQMDS